MNDKLALFDKRFFPVFKENPSLVYMDSAASTQTHSAVIQAMEKYYTEYRANVGRGEYALSERATVAVDVAREQVADFLHTTSDHILFTSGATQSLNWVAEWNRDVPQVIITELEHNANIVPWLAQGRTVQNGRLAIIPERNGTIDSEEAKEILRRAPSGSLLSISYYSNVSGIYLKAGWLAYHAKLNGVGVCIDACQAAPHYLDIIAACEPDWIAFSAHKMYGPTGCGALYVKADLDDLRPLMYGGGAVTNVTFGGVDYSSGVSKHEPGTPNIASIIGFGVACELYNYVEGDAIIEKKIRQVEVAKKYLFDMPGLTPIADYQSGKETRIFSMVTYIPDKVHSADISGLLARTNLAVRTGRLCAHPYVDKVSGGKGVVRVSFGLYTNLDDFKNTRDILTDTMNKL